MGISDIIGRQTRSAFLEANARKTREEIVKSATKVDTGQSFITLAEAQQAQMTDRLNDNRSGLVNISQFKSNQILATGDNSNHLNWLQNFKAKANEFEENVISFEANNSQFGSREDLVNKFFDDVETLLNQKSGGKYMLNPSNPNEKPIQGQLRNIDTIIVNGVATTSYTTAEDNMAQIGVADATFVRSKPLYAGAPFIMEYLALATTYKNNGSDAEYEARSQAGNREYGIIFTNLENAQKEIANADNKNTSREAELLQENSSIASSRLEIDSLNLSTLLQSLTLSFSLQAGLNSSTNQITQLIVSAA